MWIIKIVKFNAFNLLGYVRRVYTTAINFPCITPLNQMIHHPQLIFLYAFQWSAVLWPKKYCNFFCGEWYTYDGLTVVHLNFRAGSTFPVTVCMYCTGTVSCATRLTRSGFRLNLLLLRVRGAWYIYIYWNKIYIMKRKTYIFCNKIICST